MRARLIAVPDYPVQGHDGCHHPGDLLSALLLVGFDVAGRVSADVDIVDHPDQHLLAAAARRAEIRGDALHHPNR